MTSLYTELGETGSTMITGSQVREARLLLGWGQWRLAKAARLSAKIIARIESAKGTPDISELRAASLKAILEEAGVEFIVDGSDVEVRLRNQGQG